MACGTLACRTLEQAASHRTATHLATPSPFPNPQTRFDTLSGAFLSIKGSSPSATSPSTTDASPGATADTSTADGATTPRLLIVSQASVGASVAVDLPACSSVVHAVNAVLMPDLSSGTHRRRRT